MNAALQNRLVGTIIVVALVVILLPELLDGEKIQSSTEFVDIPPAPPRIEVEEVEPFPQELLDENLKRPVEIVEENALDDPANEQDDSSANESLAQNASVQAQSAAPVGTSATQSAPTAAEAEVNRSELQEVEIEVKDSGYVVQLGSFRYMKNVNELMDTLKKAGYRAFTRPVQTSAGRLNKVFVGPELQRERLEQALPHLQEITNLKGKITAFEVSAE